MAAATGLVVIKKFQYRDDPNETWSNKYWFTGPVPGPSTEWRSLFDALVSHEKKLYPASVTVIGGYGYDDSSDGAQAIWGVDLEALGQTVAGVLPPSPGMGLAGDQAAMIQWKTSRKNSRGKWIYLRKYFHGGHNDSTNPDIVSAAFHTELQAFADLLAVGDATWTRKIRSAAQDEVLQTHEASWNVTTRTLKRRGKRPS